MPENNVVPSADLTTGGTDAGKISLGATTITVTNQHIGDEAWAYMDLQPHGDAGDFEIKFTYNCTTAGLGSTHFPVMLADALDTPYWLFFGSPSECLGWDTYPVVSISHRLHDGGSDTEETLSPSLSPSTNYYVTFSRSGTTLSISIKTGSHEGTEIVSDSITCSSDGFRYLMFANGYGDGVTSNNTNYTISDITENIREDTGRNVLYATPQAYIVDFVDADDLDYTPKRADYIIDALTQTYVMDVQEIAFATFVGIGEFVVAGVDLTALKVTRKLVAEPAEFLVQTALLEHQVALETNPATMFCETQTYTMDVVDIQFAESHPPLIAIPAEFTIDVVDVTLDASVSVIVPFYYSAGA